MPAQHSFIGRKPSRLRHGHALKGNTSRIYWVWAGMIQRCTNPKHVGFSNYGSRGINVCERWFTFDFFLADMGVGKKGWSIERVDNDGDYELVNCVWANRMHQNRNSRHNRVFTVLSVTACLSELCEHFGISYGRTKQRVRKGWPVESALFQPDRYWRHKSSPL